MEYILSKYTVYTEGGDDVILWSTINAKGFVFKKNEIINKLLKKYRFKLEDINNNACLKRLYDENIILTVDDANKEYKLVDYRYNSVVYNANHLAITIIPTDACNFKCVYCYQPNEEKKYMNKETADNIISMIEKSKTLKSLNISWFGGEPLCNKKIIFYMMEKLNEICNKNKIHLISQITTNGALLDKETFEKLISLKVIMYQITIDGSRKTHNIQRPYFNGQPSYDDVINNIKEIQTVKSNVFKVGIRTNCSELIEDNDMESMFQDLENIIKNDKRFYFFFQWVKNWGGERIKSMSSQVLFDNEAIDKYGTWMSDSIKHQIVTANPIQIKPLCVMCSASAKYSFLINYDGTLHKCDSAMYGDIKDLNHIGYVSKSGNLYLDERKNSLWMEREYNIEKCRECPQYPLCCGATCPLARISNKNISCDLDCKYVKVIIKTFYKQNQLEEIG